MHIYRTKDIRHIDKCYTDSTGVSEEALIERAAGAFVHAFTCRETVPGKVLVIAGPGNNGADTRSVARLLEARGWETCLWNFPDASSVDPVREAWDMCLKQLPAGLRVVDGLFGSGLSRPVTGPFARIIEDINNLGAKVYAVDIPSGLQGDGNTEVAGPVVRATVTLTFQFPKLAFFFAENFRYTGEWEVLDIGMGARDYPGVSTPYRMIEPVWVNRLFPRKRHPFSYKNQYGHALLLAGSRGKVGAALLAARSCLRMGTGLLTVHVPAVGEIPFYSALPEAMLSVDSHAHYAGDMPSGLELGQQVFTAVGAGPGLGKSPETVCLMERLLTRLAACVQIPRLVLDADALNIVSENPRLLSLIPARSVLTPHPGEFDRLAAACGLNKPAGGCHRVMQAIQIAAEQDLVVVLKGRYTLIATPKGPHWFNSTGNPGMATAGSGDVLTGIILGLLAQGYDPAEAAVLGVYLHGKAGDSAVAASSEHAVLAGDIISHL